MSKRVILRIVAVNILVLVAGCTGPPAAPESLADPPAAEDPTDCGTPPSYEWDPDWPPLLPNGWYLGGIAGVATDGDDNVWVFHRSGVKAGDGGVGGVGTGPPVIQFDPSGNVLRGWGGPGDGYDWPSNEHGIGVDPDGNVWLTGNGAADHALLKFTGDGEFLFQIGGRGVSEGSNDVNSVRGAADVAADEKAVYVADGYGNKRVIVFDLNGTYENHWGAYGNVPDDDVDDTSQQFGGPVHGITLAADGTVFVGDRDQGRVHAFAKNGTFLREYLVPPGVRDEPAAFDVALVQPEEDFLVIADAWLAGGNDRVVIVCRWTGELVSEMYGGVDRAVGGPGAPFVPGQTTVLHAIAADSEGNLYLADMFHGGTGGSVHKLVRVD